MSNYAIKNYSTAVNPSKSATQPSRIFSALVLTSILCLCVGATLPQAANAAPEQLSQSAISEAVKSQPVNNSLPSQLANAVRKDLSRRVGIAPGKLKITKSKQQTWRNGCLELPRPDEFCTAVLVPGWRISLSDGNKTWVYHTDNRGRVLRLENQTASTNLPKSISDAILQDASNQSGLQISQLRIVEAEQRTWGNPCEFNFGKICTKEYNPISGWQVSVEAGKQSLVYRTDQSGDRVKLDKEASQISDAGTVKPTKIPSSELPQPLPDGAVFRAISSGGITGRTYQTTLMEDGRVMRVLVSANGTLSQPKVYQISREQMQQFQQLLERYKFSRFNQLSYRVPNGAADYITFTLTSPDATTQYADMIQNSLPQGLQEVIQAWNQITNG